MKIGLAAYRFINNDIAFNMAQIEKAMKAAQGKAELLCFGEAFLQGFDAMNWNYEHDREIAVTQDSEIIRSICAMTVRYRVDLLFGYLEREGDYLYSSCMVIENGKILHNYRRISQGWKKYWLTDSHYCEGDEVEDFDYKGMTFRIALCGDMWDYPERFQTEGILLWPVCCNFTIDEWKKEEETAYIEKACGVARKTLFVDAIEDGSSCLHAAFFFADGVKLAGSYVDTETILYVEI